MRVTARRQAVELFDKIAVVAGRLLRVRFEPFEDRLDAIEGGENERDGFGGDRHAVAELAHQVLGGVRQRFEPRQSEKAAGSFDGMNQTKNIAEDFAVIRLLLETHQFGVDLFEVLAGFGQKIPQQLVHYPTPLPNKLAAPAATTRRRTHRVHHLTRADGARHPRQAREHLIGPVQSVAKGFNFYCEKAPAWAGSGTRKSAQPAVKTTVSPSAAAATVSPQSRARMPV